MKKKLLISYVVIQVILLLITRYNHMYFELFIPNIILSWIFFRMEYTSYKLKRKPILAIWKTLAIAIFAIHLPTIIEKLYFEDWHSGFSVSYILSFILFFFSIASIYFVYPKMQQIFIESFIPLAMNFGIWINNVVYRVSKYQELADYGLEMNFSFDVIIAILFIVLTFIFYALMIRHYLQYKKKIKEYKTWHYNY